MVLAIIPLVVAAAAAVPAHPLTVCQILKDPRAFAGRQIVVSGRARASIESDWLGDPSCPGVELSLALPAHRPPGVLRLIQAMYVDPRRSVRVTIRGLYRDGTITVIEATDIEEKL